VAAQLRESPGSRVELRRGGFGELSVQVNGRTVYDGNRLWYPLPGTVVASVRRELKRMEGSTR
jgi:hypothetical protein